MFRRAKGQDFFGDLKEVDLILGMPDFLCFWDSRAEEDHYTRNGLV